ncbi:MAG: cation-transporting P-type ATPase [Ruminococcaceae bacterium]|nr:cation-transporting P-type ATPase [Oscillospiraceae bacterium]
MTDNWYQLTGEATAEKLKTSPKDGLTRKAARVSMRKHGKNEIYPVSKITFFNVLKAMTLDYTSYLLIAAALIAAVFEESVGAWVLVVLVALNLIVVLLSYAKSQRMLESMDRYTLPVVRVIRDGRLFMIDQKQLVPGDLICVSRGDIVPADARLITADDLCVDEERLFGKGSLHRKLSDLALHETLPPEKQRNMIFAGTLVSAGQATAIVTATGDATIISLTDKNRPIINHESIPLLGRLSVISRRWSLVVIGAVFVLTLLDFLMPSGQHALFSSFMGAMSFAVSTMSEMYVAFGYIMLACAVYQTVQQFRDAGGAGAIIKNPICMDKLRGMTAIMVPKEGIFTTRDTVADRVFAEDRLWDIADRRGRRAMERPILYAILSTGMYGEAYLRSLSEGTGRLTRTEEETSILNLARRMDIYNVRLDRAYPLLDHRSVGGESEYDTTLVQHKEQLMAISRGECESLLSHCEYYYKNGRIMLLTPEVRTSILIAYRKLVRQAYSIVAVSSRAYAYNNLKFIGAAQREMVFEGFVAFRVPYLRGVGQLITDAKDAGIKVILCTERPAASEIYFAKQLGIIDRREQAVDGAELRLMKEGIRRTNAAYYRLCCGLDVHQKQEMLDYLREQGEVVGVVGQRLEDLCLLRSADISFAQNISVRQEKLTPGGSDTIVSRVSDSAGEEGCEALKFEADVIVSDATAKGSGGFSAILNTIGIAKNTDMNVIRAIKYLLCTQSARFLLVLYTILFAKEGMGAVQALFSGLFIDFIAVMILAFQKPSPGVLRTADEAEPWLKHPIRMGIPQIIIGACWACTAILSSFFAGFFGFAETEPAQGSVLFLTCVLISVLMLFSQQREDFLLRPGVRMTALHALSLLALFELILLFFLFPTFGMLFGVSSFSPIALVIIAIFALITLVLAECIKILARMRQRPDLHTEDEATEARHSQITALFHLFRAQKAQEEAREAAEMASESIPQKKKKKRFAFRSAEQEQKLVEMEQYIAAQREKAKMETDAAADDANANAETASTERKPHRHWFFHKKTASADMPETETQNTDTPKGRLFAEDDADFEPLHTHTLRADDALTEAIRSGRKTHRRTDDAFVFDGGAQDEAVPEIDEALLSEIDPDDLDVTDVDMRPDPQAYAEAMKHIIDGAPTRDITVGGTDADLLTFLRASAAPEEEKKNADAADREFLGIGYLFSEAEYEAIMAEYNADGSQNPIYDTDTQPFETVSEQNGSV